MLGVTNMLEIYSLSPNMFWKNPKYHLVEVNIGVIMLKHLFN
jgi:hypothetical protein